MPSENVSVTEGLSVEVVQESAPEQPAATLGTEEPVNVIIDGAVVPYVPPRVVTPEEAREKALSGIPVEGQPISGSGQ